MTTTQHPGVTVHHHPQHGLTHVIPTGGGPDYWVRHADGAIGIPTVDGEGVTWGYLIGPGELEVIESASRDVVVMDAAYIEAAAEGISQRELEQIFDRKAS
jgi:hypothetical protein